MKIAVLGTGSLGLAYGAYLSRVTECTLVTRRKDQADSIKQNGVSVTREGTTRTFEIKATSDASSLATCDLILVATKAYDAQGAADVVASNAPTPLVLSIQSGLGAVDLFNAKCGKERVISAISYLGAKRTSDSSVELGFNLRTVVGEQDGSTTERIQYVQEIFTNAGFESEISANIDRLFWDKLTVAIVQSPLSALTGCTFGQLAESDYARSIAEAALEELTSVAKAKGVEFEANLMDNLLANWHSLKNHRASMWQDLQSSRRQTEIDFMNGAVVKIGKELGIPTPVNTMLHALVKTAESAAV